MLNSINVRNDSCNNHLPITTFMNTLSIYYIKTEVWSNMPLIRLYKTSIDTHFLTPLYFLLFFVNVHSSYMAAISLKQAFHWALQVPLLVYFGWPRNPWFVKFQFSTLSTVLRKFLLINSSNLQSSSILYYFQSSLNKITIGLNLLGGEVYPLKCPFYYGRILKALWVCHHLMSRFQQGSTRNNRR